MPTRLFHVSDLHAGANDVPEIEGALRELVARAEPKLIVVTGDLTHRGRRSEHERAAELLRSLGPPVLAIPGNHDIPYTLPARLTRPFAEFERQWETSEPVHRSDGLVVVGLNSVRPWRQQSGGLSHGALRRAAELLADSAEDALRVAAVHHHLAGAPWRTRKRPLARRSHVLAALGEAGAELVLAGHVHQSGASERREFEVDEQGRAIALLTASGLGHPRPRRRREARGLHVVEADRDEIRIETHAWQANGFVPVAWRRFPRRR